MTSLYARLYHSYLPFPVPILIGYWVGTVRNLPGVALAVAFILSTIVMANLKIDTNG